MKCCTCRARAQKHPINDYFSGTTAIVCFLKGKHLTVANAGDSRAIIGQITEKGKHAAYPLSIDQTAFREDERNRCRKA